MTLTEWQDLVRDNLEPGKEAPESVVGALIAIYPGRDN